MLNIAICDDEIVLANEIEQIILMFAHNTQESINVDVFYTGDDLMDSLNNNVYDMIFLDIELGNTTGIDLGNKIRNEFCDYTCKIVFISAKTGYEMQLFDIQPLNFLVKPISSIDLERCLKLVIKILEKENTIFEYKSNYQLNRVKIKDILYFESYLIKIVTINHEDYFNDNLDSVKMRLPNFFFKPHRSYLVNYNQVTKITRDNIFINDINKKIPLSKNSVKQVQLLQLQLEKEFSL